MLKVRECVPNTSRTVVLYEIYKTNCWNYPSHVVYCRTTRFQWNIYRTGRHQKSRQVADDVQRSEKHSVLLDDMLKQTATDNYINIHPDISTDQQSQQRTDDGCLKCQQLDRENAELKAKCDFLKYQKLSQDKASMHERRVFNARIKCWRRLNENKDTSTCDKWQPTSNVCSALVKWNAGKKANLQFAGAKKTFCTHLN